MDILHALDALVVRGTNMDWIDALDGSFLCETWFFCALAYWWALCLNRISLATQCIRLTMHSSQWDTTKLNAGRQRVLHAEITQTGCAWKY